MVKVKPATGGKPPVIVKSKGKSNQAVIVKPKQGEASAPVIVTPAVKPKPIVRSKPSVKTKPALDAKSVDNIDKGILKPDPEAKKSGGKKKRGRLNE